jgi:hypothetical protein
MGRFPDCKTCLPDETTFHKLDPYEYEPKWPDSPAVKIIAHWPAEGKTIECTGVLVGETAALTAGHCVFTHKTEYCDTEAPCWVDNLEIIAYQDSNELNSGYAELLTWTAWTENRDYNYDLAGVKLDTPLGSTIGWLGFGFNNEDQIFLNPCWEHTSFPVDADGTPISSGLFSFRVITNHLLNVEGTSNFGQSGTGSHSNNHNHIVYSILSHHRSFEEIIHTGHTRITSDKFFALRDWINGNMKDLNFDSFLPLILN